MNLATTNAAPRGVFALPLIGRVLRDIQREPDAIWYLLVTLLTGLVLAVQTWGLVALTMTALAAVPVIFVLLILITQG